jgi:pentatricopeptide repeat protein
MKDTQPGNVMLTICLTNNLHELALKTYEQMKERGLLDLVDGDVVEFTVGGTVSPSQKIWSPGVKILRGCFACG